MQFEHNLNISINSMLMNFIIKHWTIIWINDTRSNFRLIFKVFDFNRDSTRKKIYLGDWCVRTARVARMSLEERSGVGLERKGISRVETYVWIRGKRFILRGESDLSAPSSPHPDPLPPHPSRRNLDLQIHPGHDYFAFLLSSFLEHSNARRPTPRTWLAMIEISPCLISSALEYCTVPNFFFSLFFLILITFHFSLHPNGYQDNVYSIFSK